MNEYDENQYDLVRLFGSENGEPFAMLPEAAAAHDNNNLEEPPPVINEPEFYSGAEEMESLAKYQHIASGFFAQTKEPTLTINKRKISVNAAAARLFPNVDYMEILINSEDRRVAYLPSSEYSVRSYQWARDKGGRRYGAVRTGPQFVLCICQIMGWDPNKRYKIRGRKVPSDIGEQILLFDLKDGGGAEKVAADHNGMSELMPEWNGTFGPLFSESERKLQIDKFDGYAYFSLKNGWVDPDTPAAEGADAAE